MPKIVDREAYRDELLDRCLEVFAERGYRAATMRGLASALDVSTGTLYHYVANKGELFDRTVARATQQVIAGVLADLSRAEALDERLAALAAFVHARRDRLRGLLLTVLDAAREPDGIGSDAIAATVRRFRETIAQQLKPRTEAGAGLVLEVLVGRLVHQVVDPATPPPLAATVAMLRAALAC